MGCDRVARGDIFARIKDHTFFSMLGRIAYASGRMFLALERLVMGMLADAEGVAVVTVDYSYADLDHLANALIDRLIKGEKEFQKVTGILKTASRLYVERNKIMHGEWTHAGSGVYCNERWRARGKLIHQEDIYTTDDLLDIYSGLEQCRLEQTPVNPSHIRRERRRLRIHGAGKS